MSKAVSKGSAGPWVLAASTVLSSTRSVLGIKSGSQAGGKSERSQQPPTKCPECSSLRIWKDGLRYIKSETGTIAIQRYICRSCGRRFSETEAAPPRPHRREPSLERKRNVDLFDSYLKPNTSHYKTNGLTSTCQVCVTETQGAKNLVKVETRQKRAAGATELGLAKIKGLIIQFMAWCEAQGYPQGNKYHHYLKRLVRLGANLLNPESVKATIGKHSCKNGTKMLFVYAYDAFTRMLKIEWDRPKYKQEETLPFVPEESELDQLIAACRSKRMAAFLQSLKETYADPGEVLRLRWIDISGNVITINRPVKGHNPRQLKVSNKLLAMLNVLPKSSERIFPTTYQNMFTCYSRIRKRAAQLQHNPRLLAIHFRSFRHWGGSMIAHYTNGNVLTVKKLLGHKRIENTMKYISMIHFKDDQFEVTTATNIEEAKKVLSAGFDYVTQKDSIMLFRRPKRFH